MSKEPYNLHFNFRTYWLISWTLLIIGSIIALVDVSKQTCDEHIPILLSRALTTDPYRGGTLVFCVFAAISSIYLNSILLTVAFFGFFASFLVSMFETATSHDALILGGALLVMWECWPGKNIYWKIHWYFTVASSFVCLGWFMYAIFWCDAVEYTDGPLPDSVRCRRCSWWYITEYVTFWSMFMLVYWKIDPSLQWRDHYSPVVNKDLDRSKSITKKKQKAIDF